MSFFNELKRRNVIRVGIAYAVLAWLLLQVSDTLVPALHLPEWFHSGVALLLILGFPVALLFAWAFELTPEGLKKEKDLDRSQSITHVTGRKLNVVIIVLLAVTTGYFAYDKFVLDAETDEAGDTVTAVTAPKSIAVLPFVPMSSGEDDDYFADGLTEEILNVLAQVPELQVTARTSSFFFKGQNLPIPEIAARLDVAHVVEGSVRRHGEQVRITAQLIRAADGFHLWSNSYDRTLENVFAVQEDIAANIAAVLNVVLDDAARESMRNTGIRNVEAFIDYQKGLEAFAAAHENPENIAESLAAANVYFDRALEAAPNLVTARILKADLAGHNVFDFAVNLRDEEVAGEAQEALMAVQNELDMAWRLSPPGNQRDILDLERALFRDDWKTVPARIEKAMQAGRCTESNWITEFIGPFGWAELIADQFRETLVCDPVSFSANVFLPLMLVWLSEPEAALQAIDEAKDNGVAHPWLEDAHFIALLAAGRTDDPAIRDPQPEGSVMLYDRRIFSEALAGDPAVARQLAEEHWSKTGVDDWSSLMVAAVVGDRERANRLAARIDARPGSALVLSSSIFNCYCGATFDLEATPNYKARIEEAGFLWPPAKPIDYPMKSW
jgi:TolB-like protein